MCETASRDFLVFSIEENPIDIHLTYGNYTIIMIY